MSVRASVPGRRALVRAGCIGILVGAGFWVVDALIDSWAFSDASLLDALASPEPVELWMRSVVVVGLVAYMLRTQGLVSRYQAAVKALTSANLEADRANREKSELIATLSHEIRTPMTAILGNAEEVLASGDLSRIPPERLRAMRAIQSNGVHLIQVLDSMLDLARLEHGELDVERGPLSPVQLVGDVVSQLRFQAQAKGVDIRAEFPEPIPGTIRADATRLRQVLVNLTGNAVKFTEDGSVRIITRLSSRDVDASLQFDVVDTGIGMTPEELARVFHAYAQADHSIRHRYGGTGLGLSICKQLLHLMGGGIEIESAFGVGTTVRVTVPIDSLEGVPLIRPRGEPVEDDSLASLVDDLDACRSRLGGCRVLLVEDNLDNQRLLRRLLERVGIQVDVAADGRTAVGAALASLENDEPFDIVLMDMELPVLDGCTATRSLRNEGYELPIIALTAHALDRAREECLAAGCDDFATKPINLLALVQAISRHYRGKRSNP